MADTKCIFCRIVSEKNVEIFYEDEEFISFEDIHPASTFHYLVIPKQHITQASMFDCDVHTLRKLHDIGKELLLSKNIAEDDMRFGFHRPPFNSINHLHLHSIAPVSKMGYLKGFVYWANTRWFTEIKTLIAQREQHENPKAIPQSNEENKAED